MSTKPRSPGYRVLREDYVEFCQNNTVAALLLHYFESMERARTEAGTQNETLSEWRTISGKSGGRLTYLKPAPSRETVRRALDVLVHVGLLEAHPDNGRPDDGQTAVPASRFRLCVARLRQMETAWASQSQPDATPTHATNVAYPMPSALHTHATNVAYPMPSALHTHATNVAEEVLIEVLPESPVVGVDARARKAEEAETDRTAMMARVFTQWQGIAGPLTGLIADDLKDMVAEYGEHWVVEAMKDMGRGPVRRPNTKYLLKILESWRANGFRGAPASTLPAASGEPRTGAPVATETLRRQLDELKRPKTTPER